MDIKLLRRLLVLAFLVVGAASCGDSSLLAPDCVDPAQCEHLPDSGGGDGDGEHLPDSGG